VDLSTVYEKNSIYTLTKSQEANIKKKSQKKKIKLGRCMIRHDSGYKNLWDLFVILLVLVNCITIPLSVSMSKIEFLSSPTFKFISVCIDITFGVDIIVNFCSTYISPDTGELVVDRWKIAKNYMFGSRFLVDVLASFPFELVLPKVDEDAISGDSSQ
jgi:hypothetical protein